MERNDGFVNAAGFLIAMRPLAQTPTEDFDVTLNGNLRAAFVSCKAAMPLLEKGDAPSLVNIASGLVHLSGRSMDRIRRRKPG